MPASIHYINADKTLPEKQAVKVNRALLVKLAA